MIPHIYIHAGRRYNNPANKKAKPIQIDPLARELVQIAYPDREIDDTAVKVTQKNIVPNFNYYNVWKANTMSQMDLAGPFAQGEPTLRYILVIVDIVTRKVAAKALPNKAAETVARALAEILDNGFQTKYIKSDLGPEFNNQVMKNMLAQRGIGISYKVKGRSNQTAIADAYVGIIVRALVSMNTYTEMTNDYPNGPRRAHLYLWNRFLQPVVDKINESVREEQSFEEIVEGVPIIKQKLLPIGTKVRIPILQPYDPIYERFVNSFERGHFRLGDYRYDPTKQYEITDIVLLPGQHPRYVVGEIKQGEHGPEVFPLRNVTWIQEELQII